MLDTKTFYYAPNDSRWNRFYFCCCNSWREKKAVLAWEDATIFPRKKRRRRTNLSNGDSNLWPSQHAWIPKRLFSGSKECLKMSKKYKQRQLWQREGILQWKCSHVRLCAWSKLVLIFFFVGFLSTTWVTKGKGAKALGHTHTHTRAVANSKKGPSWARLFEKLIRWNAVSVPLVAF